MSFIQYIGNFENSEGSNIQVTISDLSTGSISDPPSYVHMTLDESGYEDETENTYDPFEPIRGSRGFLYVKTDNNVGLRTFSSGEDGRFRVDVSQSSQAILSGYLVMDDIAEKYLPKGHTMQLLFNDGLGLLKNKELTNFDGERPVDYVNMLDVVLWCLKKTNLDLDVKIAVNLFEENHDDRSVSNDKCPFAQTYVKAQTFEKDYGEIEDCYTVLTKILSSFNARIYQHHGAWWITRIPEYYNFGLSYTWYTWDGTVVSGTIEQQFDKYVGHADNAGSNCYFINTDNDVRLKRPAKNTLRVFNYNFPDELPKNVNIERGNVQPLVNIPGAIAYELDDWTVAKGFGGNISLAGSTPYIAREINALGYETARYIYFPFPGVFNSLATYIQSSKVQLCERDKFRWSFEYSAAEDHNISGSTTIIIGLIYLVGDDGNYYVLGDNSGPEWLLSNAQLSVNGDFYGWSFNGASEQLTDWRSFSIEADPLPVSGDVYFVLFAGNQQNGTTADNLNMRYKDLRLEIYRSVNSSYGRYTAEEYKIEKSGDYPKQDETESYLADAPCNEYIGAMFTAIWNMSGTAIIDYALTTNWHDWALQNGGETGIGDDRFVKWGAYSIHNWNRRHRYKITADFARLNSNTNNHIGLHHRVLILGNTEAATYKRYVITYLRRNWRDCTFTANLVEIYDTTESGRFGDTFTFKYKV